jgi:CrcB protein
VARYLFATHVHAAPGTFPWPTLAVNVSGAFVLGLLIVRLRRRPVARALAATGFLGAYTTFSTLAVDADLLGKDGHVWIALAYVTASLVVGMAAVAAGVARARRR